MNHIHNFRELLSHRKSIPILLGCVFAGILLSLFANKFEKKQEVLAENEKQIVAEERYEQKSITETELENILSCVNGVGKTKVMIIYSSSEEKILAKDNAGTDDEKTVTKSESSINEPYVIKTNSPEIEGVIVVAEGGGNTNIKNTIKDCVSDTLNVALHKVKVLEMS